MRNKLVRLYYPKRITENTNSVISKEHSHYLKNVMRLNIGAKVNFFNKEGEWSCEIINYEKKFVEVSFLKKVSNALFQSSAELAICLVKKGPMEIIFQKATELGVNKIIPIISERTEVKDLNFDRVNKIVVEATEQSNQFNPPEISKIINLKNFIDNLGDKRLFFADINSNHKLELKDFESKKIICILIGPEGDFSPLEREVILKKTNVVSFSLSKNILRTDTAVISAILLVNFINNNH